MRFQHRPLPSSLCSIGGLILDRTVSDPNFAGMAVFTPVINGEFLSTLVLQLLEIWANSEFGL